VFRGTLGFKLIALNSFTRLSDCTTPISANAIEQAVEEVFERQAV